MNAIRDADRASIAFARRALLTTAILAMAGSGLGVAGILQRTVAGFEAVLVLSALLFSTGVLVNLLIFRRVALQTVATAATVYFAIYLCACSTIAVTGTGRHLNLFIYLVWFFPLLVFNKLVNAPAVGRLLAKGLLFAPPVILCCLASRLVILFQLEFLILLVAYCLSYLAFGLMFDAVTRYREEYVIERERAESLKIETEVLQRVREQAELLDKAQDAIFVRDMENRVLYWNKSAERLYGWAAEEVTGRPLGDIFQNMLPDMDRSLASVLEHGEWSGELSQRHRDGAMVIVESRCTLVSEPDGRPRSILAINTDITNRKGAEAKIRHLAFYDALTDLPNRQLLRERLDKALVTAVRQVNTGALLFIDLDDFKTLNDTLGHDIGDLLLRQVAIRLKSCVRASDTVARLGGDEFVVMLEGLSEDDRAAAIEAKAIADKILAEFTRPYQIGNYEYNTTGSIGVTLFPGGPDTVDDLLKRADLAMYRAKAQGRNAMCFFDPAMETLVASRAALEADLRQALPNGEFELHYQPQVDSDEQVIGAEALLRWRHPRRGMVPPNEFIPVAEEVGLIGDIGRWVLETACAQLAEWMSDPEMDRLNIAVNVSVRQFLDPNFVTLVREVVRESGANPHRLKLEMTESSMMDRVDETIATMTALKAYGVGFSLDDFGTGYSCLSRLKGLPLDQLKIDRSFVNDVLTDSRDASIARTIITLGRDLNLSVIAEGVETEGQRKFLENEGCHTYQGYLFSPALPASRFEAFVAAHRLEEMAV